MDPAICCFYFPFLLYIHGFGFPDFHLQFNRQFLFDLDSWQFCYSFKALFLLVGWLVGLSAGLHKILDGGWISAKKIQLFWILLDVYS